MFATLAVGKLRQEDHEFKASFHYSLDSISRPLWLSSVVERFPSMHKAPNLILSALYKEHHSPIAIVRFVN